MTYDAALIIKVNVQEHGGLLYAASPDLPGLHICGTNPQQLCESVVRGVETLFELNRGIKVTVAPVITDVEEFEMPSNCTEPFDQVVVQRIAA